MDTYNEELSCAVNVTEAGRQARAELKIMEKESSCFHELIKFVKQNMTRIFS